jgi:UDP-glucose 4-epimerase
MKRLLMVGGNGFIGRSLVDHIVRTGGRKIIITGRSNQAKWNLPDGVSYQKVSIDDLTVYETLLDWADEVVDFAYSSVPQTSFDDPIQDVLDNLPFNVGLLKLASERYLGKFIFISSGGTVYGPPVQLPISEDHPTNPVSPYGITKLAVEKYGLMYWRSRGLQFIAVRPANPYGPGQHGGRGQGFVATAMQQVLDGKQISIFGENGTIRDYIYVVDLAKGILAALDCAEAGSILNIGTGVGIDNRQMLDALSIVIGREGKQLNITSAPGRSFDVSANILDSSRLQNISRWKPEVSLQNGLERTWDWVKSVQK